MQTISQEANSVSFAYGVARASLFALACWSNLAFPSNLCRKYLLSYLDTVPSRGGVRSLFMRLIILILRREEFSPKQIGLFQEFTTVQCSLDSPILEGKNET